jgi:putative ABC transport system permease protein
VASIRRSGMHDVPPARVYLPFAQYPNAALSVVVRSTTGPANTIRDLEAVVAGIDPALLVEGARTLEADAAQFVAPIRLMTSLLAGFAVAGILLSALGVFGSMSYAVSQRQQEMAVRSALGATRAHIRGVILGAALRMVLAGLTLGAAATLVATRALETFLFGVGSADFRTIASVGITLTLVALAACYRPARTAAAADPLPLLRR